MVHKYQYVEGNPCKHTTEDKTKRTLSSFYPFASATFEINLRFLPLPTTRIRSRIGGELYLLQLFICSIYWWWWIVEARYVLRFLFFLFTLISWCWVRESHRLAVPFVLGCVGFFILELGNSLAGFREPISFLCRSFLFSWVSWSRIRETHQFALLMLDL